MPSCERLLLRTVVTDGRILSPGLSLPAASLLPATAATPARAAACFGTDPPFCAGILEGSAQGHLESRQSELN